jgi:hypothetical protein
MRSLLLGCALGLGLAAMGADAPAQAQGLFPWQIPQTYRWCAFYNAAGGITECLYQDFAQCRASVSGVGGHCYENPAYVPPPPPVRRPPARRKPRS